MHPTALPILLVTSALVLGGCATSHGLAVDGVRWVDLSHDYAADTIYWPTAPGFEIVVDAKGQTDNGYWYEANTIRTAEIGRASCRERVSECV